MEFATDIMALATAALGFIGASFIFKKMFFLQATVFESVGRRPISKTCDLESAIFLGRSRTEFA
jgi:hypothetical protein